MYSTTVPDIQKRTTQWINRKPAANLHHATRYAERINLPLNTFVTINLTELGIDTTSSSEAFQKVIGERFAPWLRRTADNITSVPPTYVWTLEAANENHAVHWVVHIPKNIERHFRQALERWVAELASGAPSPQALKVLPVYNIPRLKGYILKGTEPHYARLIGINPVDQGTVYGKRSGFSRNLGPSVRKRNGYRPRRLFVPLSYPLP